MKKVIHLVIALLSINLGMINAKSIKPHFVSKGRYIEFSAILNFCGGITFVPKKKDVRLDSYTSQLQKKEWKYLGHKNLNKKWREKYDDAGGARRYRIECSQGGKKVRCKGAVKLENVKHNKSCVSHHHLLGLLKKTTPEADYKDLKLHKKHRYD